MQTSVNGGLEDSEEAAGNGEVSRVRGVKQTSKQATKFQAVTCSSAVSLQ